MRKPLIAANWKMNTTPAEAITLVKQMLPELNAVSGVETLLCPPFISLVAVSELLKQSHVMLGAQNAYYEDKGAFTGEISPPDARRFMPVRHPGAFGAQEPVWREQPDSE